MRTVLRKFFSVSMLVSILLVMVSCNKTKAGRKLIDDGREASFESSYNEKDDDVEISDEMEGEQYREEERIAEDYEHLIGTEYEETMKSILKDETLSEEQKIEAIDFICKMKEITDKEQAAEKFLEEVGFKDVVVNIVDEAVDVVINATSVTDRQIALIEEIVMRETGAKTEDITIMAASKVD